MPIYCISLSSLNQVICKGLCKNDVHNGALKLQPAIFPSTKQVIRFHELPAEKMQRILQ